MRKVGGRESALVMQCFASAARGAAIAARIQVKLDDPRWRWGGDDDCDSVEITPPRGSAADATAADALLGEAVSSARHFRALVLSAAGEAAEVPVNGGAHDGERPVGIAAVKTPIQPRQRKLYFAFRDSKA